MGAVIDAHGRLFTWGDGGRGMLGHGDRTPYATPRQVLLPLSPYQRRRLQQQQQQQQQVRITAVSLGHAHTVRVSPPLPPLPPAVPASVGANVINQGR